MSTIEIVGIVVLVDVIVDLILVIGIAVGSRFRIVRR